MPKNDADYHRARASHELNLGLTSSSLAAARSHLALSSLHKERVKQLEGNSRSEAPPFIL